MRNYAQRRCRYCRSHGGDYGRHPGECLTKETVAELKTYAAANGRNWRHKLRCEWMNGAEVLRELRNRVGAVKLDQVHP